MKVLANGWLLSAIFVVAGNAMAGGMAGTVRVAVHGPNGDPLQGAQVSAESQESPSRRSAETGSDGIAWLLALDPGAEYRISVRQPGYSEARQEGVLVTSGGRTDLVFDLTSPPVIKPSLLEVTSAVAGQSLRLGLTESVPTGRSYQSYLQIVPGVLPDDPQAMGNPASRAGLNYTDVGGELGVSRDNRYFLEGIDVTDPVTGTFGANLNVEIIQEQKVITGGIPAEYRGSPGLTSSVVTKLGGNDWSGSVSYFFQNDGLQADNDNLEDGSFETMDAALALSGPVVRNKAWFFASYRKLVREDDVTSFDTGQFLRTVENDHDQYSIKITYEPTPNDRLSGTFLGDPAEVSGQVNPFLVNSRDIRREQGGDRYAATYRHLFRSAVLSFAVGKHNGEVSDLAADVSIRNEVLFEANQVRTLADEQLGGAGNLNFDERDTEFYRASTEWLLDTSWGHHTLKGGAEFIEQVNLRERRFTDGGTSFPQQVQSLDPLMQQHCTANGCVGFNGVVDAQFVQDGSFSGSKEFQVDNATDLGGLIAEIEEFGPTGANPDAVLYAAFLALFDVGLGPGLSPGNGNGMVDLGDDNFGTNIVFDSMLGNPNGRINYNRDLQTTAAPQETSSEGLSFYLQDTWQLGKWTVNVGVRAERWEHFATSGEKIFEFDWEYAPRIGVVFDPTGNGRQKISAFYGRYFDPVRNNMTNLAGTLIGRVTEEQVYVAGNGIEQYVAYRTRGDDVMAGAVFAPTTETPFTDEYTLSYQRDLGGSMSVEANVIRRETQDIIEDYNPTLYAAAEDGTSTYPAGPGGTQSDPVSLRLLDPADAINHPDSLFLGLGYFGFEANPGSNFIIATLEGAERTWDGLELIFRKRYRNHWQAIASYSYAEADGNSNSDSDADFQGDVLFLDPRAPNMTGRQPGMVRTLIKTSGSYRWNNGIELGATLSWNSGTVASRTFQASRRHLPERVSTGDEFEFAGITARWTAPDSVGGLTNPSYSVLDLRLRYDHKWGRVTGAFFVDLFNALDEQDPIRNQDLVAGSGNIAFGEPVSWVPPRRIFLGARASF